MCVFELTRFCKAAEVSGNIGALIFAAHYTIVKIRNPQNSIGNYIGPYSTQELRPRGTGSQIVKKAAVEI